MDMAAEAIHPEAKAELPYYKPVGDEVVLFEAACLRKMPLLLKGPTGVGKTRFVAHAVAALRVGNAAVEKNRAEDYRDEAGFDTVMCRAFGSLSKIIRTSGHLCAPTGCILAMKGRYPEQELGGVDHAWSVREVEKLVVPGLEGDRHIVEVRRV